MAALAGWYNVLRTATYGLLWAFTVIVLGLASYRVHYTTDLTHSYEPIIVELICSAILAIVGIPILFFLVAKGHLVVELVSVFILWVFFLVGSVDVTNDILPGDRYCDYKHIGGENECDIVTTLLAFSWMSWSLLTIVGVLALMQWAKLRGAPAAGTYTSEKRAAPVGAPADVSASAA
ncbi:hypothetical protein CYLTODRAFT_424619 [Cylindrobasidium torrendii FP15055 ss-10]|uniref:MARVEL domain-containing protein n=1 Tax=Cylindrobasidium torrendii FP15055 ss-10 TaxID=1314674 RepID=A0A0D7B3R1_9AGAR|nr:hypothetical protein CYLTODRAFT_424619 [Cylindrobasidium torrendii FP15055 ss-10]